MPNATHSRPCLATPAPARPATAIHEASRLVRIMLEALTGRRALHQVRERMQTPALLQLTTYVDTGRLARAVPGRIRLQMPSARAVEAVTLLRVGPRWLVCTLRLDRGESRWQCSSIDVLGL